MGCEEAPGLVHQELVRTCLQPVRGAPEPAGDLTENLLGRTLPAFPADAELPPVDLPAVAHGFVENRIRAAAVRRSLRHSDKGADLGVEHGERDRADPLDNESRHWRHSAGVNAVVPGRSMDCKRVSDFVTPFHLSCQLGVTDSM